ncbi:MAG: hypothetical protein Q7T73_09825, partial [Beijerinckiaceae bacterium]|nr:hypothetical protein [Beijerinckiaceae bacterium]
MSSSDQPQHDASTRPPPGLSAIELLLWRHHNETTDPDPEPAQPYDIDKDFRRAPPVHREAHVILPEWSEIDHDSIFGIHLRASAEKPAEEKALANKRKAARDQRKADKAAASGETVEPKAKKPKKPRTAEQTLDDEKHRARVLTENAMADDFLEHGFTHVHNRDGQVCGEDVADFSEILEIMDENGEVKEVFLRSETHDMFKQFVAYLPKAYKLKCGRDKGYVKTFSRKVLSAMQSYVTMGTN